MLSMKAVDEEGAGTVGLSLAIEGFCVVPPCLSLTFASLVGPAQVWGPEAVDKVEGYDEADWRVFEAANNILDLRLWTVRDR